MAYQTFGCVILFFANVQNEQFNIENNETYKMIFLKQTTYSDRFYIKYFFYNKIIEIGFKNYNFKIHNFGKLKPYYKILLEKIDIIYKIDIENNINRLNKMFKE